MSRNSLLKRINIVSIQYLSYQNDTSIGTDVCPGRVMMMYHRVKKDVLANKSCNRGSSACSQEVVYESGKKRSKSEVGGEWDSVL